MIIGPPRKILRILTLIDSSYRMVPSTFDIDDISKINPIEGQAIFHFMSPTDATANSRSLRLSTAENSPVDEHARMVGPAGQLLYSFIFVSRVYLGCVDARWLEN